jgi:two-component system, OmpR family, copper resistance phosphate regulon response regulator CusR
MIKVLLIEDDPKILSFIKIGLESNDCRVDFAYNSTVGEKYARSRVYDVIILDVVIPVISGFELCKIIREAGIATPVIFLTSLDSVDDKLTGFDSGADDYLVKPFSFQELFARVKALIRRKKELTMKPCIKIGNLEIDTVSKSVKRGEKFIPLTATEYKILELLAQNTGKVFDRIHIAENIWGQNFVPGTNVIDVHINSLRKKIDKDFDYKLILTRKGFGYLIDNSAAF